MSDEIEVSDRAKTAAMMAVLSAGDPASRGWKTRVQRSLTPMAALVRDDYGYWGKEAQGVIDATVFVGTYRGYELEESSQRLLVNIESSHDSGDGPAVEQMRTERIDTPPGRHMKERLDQLDPGQEIAAFKKIEAMRGSKDRKVRVLVHFEPIRSKSSTSSEAASRNHPPQASRLASGGRDVARPSTGESDGGVSNPPPSDSQLTGEAQAVQDGLAPLNARQRLAVKNRCVGEGIENWTDPGVEEIDRVLVIIREVGGG